MTSNFSVSVVVVLESINSGAKAKKCPVSEVEDQIRRATESNTDKQKFISTQAAWFRARFGCGIEVVRFELSFACVTDACAIVQQEQEVLFAPILGGPLYSSGSECRTSVSSVELDRSAWLNAQLREDGEQILVFAQVCKLQAFVVFPNYTFPHQMIQMCNQKRLNEISGWYVLIFVWGHHNFLNVQPTSASGL